MPKIYYDGWVADEGKRDEVLAAARAFAKAEEWGVREVGPTAIALESNEDAPPVRLAIDGELEIDDYVDTESGGIDFHLKVVALLRALEPLFDELNVEDETDFWDEGDTKDLATHFERD